MAAALDAGCATDRARHRRQRLHRRRSRHAAGARRARAGRRRRRDAARRCRARRRGRALDLTGLHPALAGAEVVVACDVDNPLTGSAAPPRSTARRRAPTRTQVEPVRAGPDRWAEAGTEATGPIRGTSREPGRPAASGFAALALLGADAATRHRAGPRSHRLPPALAGAPTWWSPARDRWTSRPCTARRRPGSRPRPRPPASRWSRSPVAACLDRGTAGGGGHSPRPTR